MSEATKPKGDGSGNTQEAERIQAEPSPIVTAEINDDAVDAINGQTISTADRFVYSPFESEVIPRLFIGASQNSRVVIG